MTQPIPVDQRIIDTYFQLKGQRGSKGVAWLFAMLATYGVKPEELTSFEWGPNNSLVLFNKKRPVLPLHPQWVFLFDLNKKRPCETQDHLDSLVLQLYRLMAHQTIDLNVTDLLLAHRIRKNYYKSVKKRQPSSLVCVGAS
jgi:hypothetical protein